MKKSTINNILKVLAVGGTAASMGAAAIGLATLSAAIFCAIPSARGYAAVVLFALAVLAVAVALAVVYVCGCWMIRKGRFSK